MENSKSKKLEYNDVPVYYCKHCLSLTIKTVPHIEDSDYCDTCGSTDIGTCSIEEWEKMYKEAHHGMSLLDKNY